MSKYNVDAGRTPEQIVKMKHLAESGVCAFCPEYFVEHHDNPIEFETEHWIVAKNDYPYEHTAVHLLLVSRKHIQCMKEMSKDARRDFMDVIARIEADFGLQSFALGMRVGDMRYNGGSVEHLHAHVVVGDKTDNSVKFRMSSLPKN